MFLMVIEMGDLHLRCLVKRKGKNLSNDDRFYFGSGVIDFACPFCKEPLKIRLGARVITCAEDLDPNSDLLQGRETHYLWKD
jgi:hypothetical protein